MQNCLWSLKWRSQHGVPHSGPWSSGHPEIHIPCFNTLVLMPLDRHGMRIQCHMYICAKGPLPRLPSVIQDMITFVLANRCVNMAWIAVALRPVLSYVKSRKSDRISKSKWPRILPHGSAATAMPIDACRALCTVDNAVLYPRVKLANVS